VKILYAIDGAGYHGGAHIATFRLIKRLISQGHEVDVLCCSAPDPKVSKEYPSVIFHRYEGVPYHSWRWLICGLQRRLLRREVYPCWLLDWGGRVRKLMAQYDAVCVMSEVSVFRPIVAKLAGPTRKVQLIHINYDSWRRNVPHSIVKTYKDLSLYAHFDKVGVVGAIGARQFETSHCSLKGKVYPFYNIIDVPRGLYVEKKLSLKGFVRLISLVRINDRAQKDVPRMIRVAKRLMDKGQQFVWDVYGAGGGFGGDAEQVKRSLSGLGLTDVFRVHDFEKNIHSIVAHADVLVLLSHFEGLPNVIIESFLVGTPVFSTAVDGVPEFVHDKVNGWLVEDDEVAIVEKMATVLGDRAAIATAHEELRTFTYDNDAVVAQHLKLLS